MMNDIQLEDCGAARVQVTVNHGVADYQVHFGELKGAARLVFSFPIVEIGHFWHPGVRQTPGIPVGWAAPLHSATNHAMPLYVFYNDRGESQVALAVSTVHTAVEAVIGVREEDARFQVTLTFAAETTAATVRFDTVVRAFDLAVRDGAAWLREVNGLVAAPVPAAALAPMYSTWYSFHQQMTGDQLAQEAQAFAQYGLETIIVDDGWQTPDIARGYAYAGDWQVAKAKFPDLRQLVANFHAQGLKFMLWVSTLHIGMKTREWATFKNRLLGVDEVSQAGLLDPRYPAVRAYLCERFVGLARQYDLDGLKLDFVDAIVGMSAPVTPDMDVASVEDALNTLLATLQARCLALKADFLIEFRQGYFGPEMTRYANMMRVGDCPNDYVQNRIGIAELRLVCPGTAVHSDMLMFNLQEPVAANALQLLNALFGVIQLSVRLHELSEAQQRMLAFWLGYQRRHRDLLYGRDVRFLAPQSNYALITASDSKQTIMATYTPDQVLQVPTDVDRIDVINATGAARVTLALPRETHWVATQLDCTGVVQPQQTADGVLQVLAVPPAGLLRLRKEEG